MVAGLAFSVLWSAAKADAVPTEFETGFALGLTTNKSCIHQNSRYLAVVTFRLLVVGTRRAVVLAIRDAETRHAQSQLSLATTSCTHGPPGSFVCQISCGFATDTFLAYSVQPLLFPSAAFTKSRGYLLRGKTLTAPSC